MTEEQQRALALARARRRREEAQSQQSDTGGDGREQYADNEYRGSTLDRTARGFGSGLADVLGAPADLMNAGFGLVGQDVERPWLGSDSIRELFGELGVAPEEGVDPAAGETLAGSIGQGFGNALGFLVPAGAVARGAQATGALSRMTAANNTSSGSRVAGQVLEELARRPALAASSEIGAGGAAGAARYAADDAGYEPGSWQSITAQTGAGLLGSLTPAAAPQLARAAGGASLVSPLAITARFGAERLNRGLRGSGAAPGEGFSNDTMNRAARTLQGQAGDLDAARLNLANTDSGDGLTAAQRSGDSGLMQVENTINQRSGNPAVEAQRQRDASNVTRATDNAGAVGDNVPVARTGEELQRRLDEFTRNVQGRNARVQQQAQAAQTALGDNRARGAVSRDFDAGLNTAYDEANQVVRRGWNNVDMDAVVPVDSLMREMRAQIDDAGSVDQLFGGTVPGPVRRLLEQGEAAQGQSTGPVTTTVRDMQNLRRVLGERAASMSSGNNPDRNGARVMSSLVRSIDDDLAATGDTGIQQAIAGTRELSDRFRRDGVARARARSGTGGEAVQPEQTLERLMPLGSNGSSTSGLAGARQINQAMAGSIGRESGGSGIIPPSSNSRRMQQLGEEYLAGEFQRQATRNGSFDAQAAQRFVRNNDELLSSPYYSDMAQRIRNAATASQRGELSESRMRQIFSRANDPRQGRAAMFIGNDTADGTYENAIANVTRGDAADNMRQLVRQVRRDESGEALNGLKSGFMAEALGRIRTADGAPDASRLRDIVSETAPRDMAPGDSALRRAAGQLFNETDRRRIREAADTIGRIQQSQSVDAAADNSLDLSGGGLNRLTEILTRVGGANAGGWVGGNSAGGSLQTAQILSGEARNAMRRMLQSPVEQLLKDAVADPRLFRELLTRDAPQRAGASYRDAGGRAIGAWLSQLPMYNTGEQEQESPQNEQQPAPAPPGRERY